MEIHIRAAVEADWPNIRDAIVQEQEYERALHDTRLPGPDIIDAYLPWFRNMIDNHRGTVFIAETDGVFLGHVGCSIVADDNPAETADSNRFGLVHDICVLAEYRGQGVAAHLLKAAEIHLAAEGVTRMRINMLAANTSAIRAYRKHGFEEYEVLFEKRIIQI